MNQLLTLPTLLKKTQLTILAALLLAVTGVLVYPGGRAFADSNLVTNPGFETGDVTGWNLLQNGGDGWSNSWGAHSGQYGFDTSYAMDSVSQKIDLIGSGYTQSQLDNQQPPITISVWLNDRCDSGAHFYITDELIGSNGSTVLASSGNTFGNSGAALEVPSPCGTWKQQTYTFTNYGSGVHYAYIEFGGYSDNYWAGNYGAQFDDAAITVNSTPALPTSLGPTTVNSGQTISNHQPTVSASLSDPGVGSQVQYEIQVSQSSSFSNPVIDYTSALAAPGPISFTVGQAAGTGTYAAGVAGQTLAGASYYWRIRAIGDDGLLSAWATANNGAVAFVVDPPSTLDPAPVPNTGYGTPDHSTTLAYGGCLAGLGALIVGFALLRRQRGKA